MAIENAEFGTQEISQEGRSDNTIAVNLVVVDDAMAIDNNIMPLESQEYGSANTRTCVVMKNMVVEDLLVDEVFGDYEDIHGVTVPPAPVESFQNFVSELIRVSVTMTPINFLHQSTGI